MSIGEARRCFLACAEGPGSVYKVVKEEKEGEEGGEGAAEEELGEIKIQKH